MSCVLRAVGHDFDVDSFLNASTLEAIVVFHRGEQSFPSTRIEEQSGINVSVSEREFSDLAGQVEDAVRFLKQNARELTRLRDFQGVEWIALDFPVRDRDVAVQRDTFPPELMSLLGSLRISLAISRYPPS
jgi:hypothetical protein